MFLEGLESHYVGLIWRRWLTYFAEWFKQVIGISPYRYVPQFHIQIAKESPWALSTFFFDFAALFIEFGKVDGYPLICFINASPTILE